MNTRFANSRQGSVLIVVIWMALGLISLTLYFSSSILMEYKAADHGQAGLECEQAIEGARRYLAFILANQTTPGIVPNLEDGEYVAEDVPIGNARFFMVGRDIHSDVPPTEPAFGLVDEASKLNINSSDITLEMLEALPGMDMDLAAAILDWADADQELTAGGAESQDYLMLDMPYNAKDSGFESPEELRLVMGIDPTVMYGEDANRNGALDANENDGDDSYPPDNNDGILQPGLVEYITTFTREPNTREDGSERIDITANGIRQRLTTLLEEEIGQERAGEIMQTMTPQVLDSIESPLEFYIESRMTQEEFALIEDAIAVSDSDYLVGLVNVSTASAPVLAVLPGMTESLAADLVNARIDKDAETLKSVAWVAAEIDPEVARSIGPFITARSYQFSADVAAFGHDGRGFRREAIVFDMEEEPIIIYRRDLTRFGWPLGESLRQPQTGAEVTQ